MVTYSLFLPIGLKAAAMTGDQATQLAQTLAILWKGARSSRTTGNAFDIQTVGAADVEAPVKGVVVEFDMSFLLPMSLEDTSVDRSGTLIGKADNADGPCARITRASDDNIQTQRLEGLLKPYPVKGDFVALVSTSSFIKALNRVVTILPPVAGNPGVFVGVNNADAIDGVYPNPFAAAQGWALIGAERSNIVVNGQAIDTTRNIDRNRTAQVTQRIPMLLGQ